jgi:hypothetical protein
MKPTVKEHPNVIEHGDAARHSGVVSILREEAARCAASSCTVTGGTLRLPSSPVNGDPQGLPWLSEQRPLLAAA